MATYDEGFDTCGSTGIFVDETAKWKAELVGVRGGGYSSDGECRWVEFDASWYAAEASGCVQCLPCWTQTLQ
jgi:hypothetical protein